MRRQVTIMQPTSGAMVAGIWRETHGEPFTAMLSMQSASSGGTFKEYLTGRKVTDYMEAIGETELQATVEGENTGAYVVCGGKKYEVVARMDWLNGVINHYEYLLFSVNEKKERITG